MLPLNCIVDGKLQKPESLHACLQVLRGLGVDGVMVDVWWGVVERNAPGEYDWSAYKQLLEIVRSSGLSMTAVMSFHACGPNVGDDEYEMPLPPWVIEATKRDPGLLYADQNGYHNPECLSLWADHTPALLGRTPLQCYTQFMSAFRREFAEHLGETIVEVTVGCGPCGELRYPAYPASQHSRWRFPGIGQFQCYDERALGALARAASKANRIEWGGSGPHDAGDYNNLPWETGFFREHGSWDSPYGQFFLEWYSGALINHGERMLKCASMAFEGLTDRIDLSIKCAGVHWWYNSSSHAAELTAGYWNTRAGKDAPERDGYQPIIELCQTYGAALIFTCVEMRDEEHPELALCGPEGLLNQVRATAARYGVAVSGENALRRFDDGAYDRIIANVAARGTTLPPMASFTFLRLTEELFDEKNLSAFGNFTRNLREQVGAAAEEEFDEAGCAAEQADDGGDDKKKRTDRSGCESRDPHPLEHC